MLINFCTKLVFIKSIVRFRSCLSDNTDSFLDDSVNCFAFFNFCENCKETVLNFIERAYLSEIDNCHIRSQLKNVFVLLIWWKGEWKSKISAELF